MKLKLKPVEIPFKVGDEVYVNLSYHALNEPNEVHVNQESTFQALIVRIFLEGLRESSIISECEDEHELIVNHLIYDLKPIGPHLGLNRVPLTIDVEDARSFIFRSHQELVDYQGLTEVDL